MITLKDIYLISHIPNIEEIYNKEKFVHREINKILLKI